MKEPLTPRELTVTPAQLDVLVPTYSVLCTQTSLWCSGVRKPLPRQSAWVKAEELVVVSSGMTMSILTQFKEFPLIWEQCRLYFQFCSLWSLLKRREVTEDTVVRLINLFICVFI